MFAGIKETVSSIVKPVCMSALVLFSICYLFDQFFTIPVLEEKLVQKETESFQLQETIKARDKELFITRHNLYLAHNQASYLNQTVATLFAKTEELEEQVVTLMTKPKNVKTVHVLSSGKSDKWSEGWTLTHYSLNVESTGKKPDHPQYGITKSGRKVEENVTIAVDPDIIPLGTWVEIKLPDGTLLKRRADDTGSAVVGKTIDLYIPDATYNQLMKLGRIRDVEVRILGKDAKL